jgi:hypothetical protein
LVEEGGGEGERGTGAWLACPVRLAAAGFLISFQTCMVLLPPSSKRYKTKDTGYCYSKLDQRVVVALEWLVEGFGGVLKEF